jgi:hypothetical protein
VLRNLSILLNLVWICMRLLGSEVLTKQIQSNIAE